MPQITVIMHGSQVASLQDIDKDEFTIGRSKKADVKYPFEGASRVHVSVLVEGGIIFIFDKSSNGTYIDGEKIPKDEKFEYIQGMQISLGHTDEYITLEVDPTGEVVKKESKVMQIEVPTLEEEIIVEEELPNKDQEDEINLNLEDEISSEILDSEKYVELPEEGFKKQSQISIKSLSVEEANDEKEEDKSIDKTIIEKTIPNLLSGDLPSMKKTEVAKIVKDSLVEEKLRNSLKLKEAEINKIKEMAQKSALETEVNAQKIARDIKNEAKEFASSIRDRAELEIASVVKKSNERQDQIEKDLAEKEDAVFKLEEKQKMLSDNVDILKKVHIEKEEKLKNIESNIKASNKDLLEIEAGFDRLKQNKAEIESEISLNKQENQVKIDTALLEFKVEKAKLLNEIKLLTSDQNILNKEIESLQSRYELLNNDLINMKDLLVEINKETMLAQEEKKVTTLDNEKIKIENNELKSEKRQLFLDRDKLSKAIEAMTLEIKEMKKEQDGLVKNHKLELSTLIKDIEELAEEKINSENDFKEKRIRLDNCIEELELKLQVYEERVSNIEIKEEHLTDSPDTETGKVGIETVEEKKTELKTSRVDSPQNNEKEDRMKELEANLLEIKNKRNKAS